MVSLLHEGDMPCSGDAAAAAASLPLVIRSSMAAAAAESRPACTIELIVEV